MKLTLTPAFIAIALMAGASAASAANPTAAQSGTPPAYANPVVADANAMRGADELHTSNLRQQLQSSMTKAGYTDVKITPSSFYIKAKDKNGNPVAMVVGPDSFTEVTEMTAKTPPATAQGTPNAMSTPAPKSSDTQK
jgi:hypothetical protein